MRIFLVMGAVATLAACGGGRVTGDVSKACMSAGRTAASPQLCSCVQQVANQSLSNRDQARAAAFFADPQRAQDTRQSSNPNDREFWGRYRAFTDLATQVCRPVTA
ncbi:arginine transporter [Yoonia sp.]|uniref:arginine transporter n=1 Tax=Yoonia sp. TaxID=2212373 RepID=UPI003A4E5EC1|nr:arginine transporter [Loktanella sp.]